MREQPVSRVVVLGTGRCGTVTFIKACQHIENFTAGHESRARMIGPDRFDYPERHIEADNRLSWLLAGLGQALDDETTLYVHLTRDPASVAASFRRRWDSPYRASIIRAFGHGIISRTQDWDDEEIAKVCDFYVQTVTANIDAFVSNRHCLRMQLEHLPDQFDELLDVIGAHGDRAAMRDTLTTIHNAS